MFSHDEFLINYANLPPRNAGLLLADPIAMRDREIYGNEIMTSEARDIVSYLDHVWAQHNILSGSPIAHAMAPVFRESPRSQDLRISFAAAAPTFGCFHLIYALLIENTRIYELFDRVIQYCNSGERLGVMQPDTRHWISLTEALFYRQQSAHDHWPLSTITSDARADGRAIRRNAYYRMFGMDLNHGTDGNKPYPYQKPDAANKRFVSTLEELFRQIWIANVNVGSTTVDETDDAQIQHLSRQLDVMLANRRLHGTLTREEFSAVATMDWLRLAVSFNSPVVIELRAQADSEADRIKKIGERVGLPAHGRSDDYFELANMMSDLLIGIEDGTYFDAATYLGYRPDILNIINNWSRATGKVLKKLPQPVVPSSVAAA